MVWCLTCLFRDKMKNENLTSLIKRQYFLHCLGIKTAEPYRDIIIGLEKTLKINKYEESISKDRASLTISAYNRKGKLVYTITKPNSNWVSFYDAAQNPESSKKVIRMKSFFNDYRNSIYNYYADYMPSEIFRIIDILTESILRKNEDFDILKIW